MIAPHSLILFVLASIALIATPGPNVALIVGTSLKHGRRAGLLSVAGVNLGVMTQLACVTVGLTWMVDLFARHFDLIRYAGAAYLAWLAMCQWRSAGVTREGPGPKGQTFFSRGLAVAFANPKTLLFHAAFLPQFVTDPAHSGPQIAQLALIFGLIALAGDVLWAMVADRARAIFKGRFTVLADRLSATLLAGGAAVLLAVGRR